MLHLIRHAESEMNQAKCMTRARLQPYSKTGVVWDKRLVDPGVTATGRQQIDAAREKLHSIPLDKVYVSPMYRALFTCEGLLQNHESRPQVIVMPYATEIISDAGDISKGNSLYQTQFPHYDWSVMQEQHPVYWMTSVSDSQILREIVSNSRDVEEIITRLCEETERKYPDHLESMEEAEGRISRLHDILESDRRSGRNVALVAHGDTIRVLIQRLVPGRERDIILHNCEIYTVPRAE